MTTTKATAAAIISVRFGRAPLVRATGRLGSNSIGGGIALPAGFQLASGRGGSTGGAAVGGAIAGGAIVGGAIAGGAIEGGLIPGGLIAGGAAGEGGDIDPGVGASGAAPGSCLAAAGTPRPDQTGAAADGVTAPGVADAVDPPAGAPQVAQNFWSALRCAPHVLQFIE